MSDGKQSNALVIFLAVFAGISLVGTVGMVMVSWVLNRSLESLIDRVLSDTGAWLIPEEELEIEEFDLEELELGEFEGEEEE